MLFLFLWVGFLFVLRERHINWWFRLFMHSVAASCVSPDQLFVVRSFTNTLLSFVIETTDQ